ncbi:MAG TPA: hypothetical protein VIL88_16720 [Devosia sp.]|jgi:cobalamin biosynthesis protein CbiD|uniref:DUF6894 family protein n=1 Tax=Devosia sp. TaxID=1871048 RepID=UPI002F93377C
MPRYYFDVRDGDGAFIDEVGVDLPNMDSAVKEARKALADMVRDALREEEGSEISILVRDGADGPILITVSLSTDSLS